MKQYTLFIDIRSPHREVKRSAITHEYPILRLIQIASDSFQKIIGVHL